MTPVTAVTAVTVVTAVTAVTAVTVVTAVTAVLQAQSQDEMSQWMATIQNATAAVLNDLSPAPSKTAAASEGPPVLATVQVPTPLPVRLTCHDLCLAAVLAIALRRTRRLYQAVTNLAGAGGRRQRSLCRLRRGKPHVGVDQSGRHALPRVRGSASTARHPHFEGGVAQARHISRATSSEPWPPGHRLAYNSVATRA